MTAIQEKVVLITGASSGIGEATARLLARRGAKVVLGARRTDRLAALVAEIEATGGTASFQRLDVTHRPDVEAFAEFALETHEQIDVLVNAAGVMPMSPLWNRKIEEWELMIDVNLRGVLLGIAAVLPTMQEQGWGHIVNVAPVAMQGVSPNLGRVPRHAVRGERDLRGAAAIRSRQDAVSSTMVRQRLRMRARAWPTQAVRSREVSGRRICSVHQSAACGVRATLERLGRRLWRLADHRRQYGDRFEQHAQQHLWCSRRCGYWFSPDTVAGFALAGGGTNFSVANSGNGRSDMFQAGLSGSYLRYVY